MSILNDSLPEIKNTTTGSGRATTPQLARISSRNNTPKRTNSAPRSTSASKAANLAKALNALDHINLSSGASHRKQRKWENDHLFGFKIIRGTDVDFDEEDIGNNSFDVHWNTLFTKLLLEENIEARKAYLNCVQLTTNVTYMPTLEDCQNILERSHFAWNKIEKRLRNVVTTSISEHATEKFIACIEQLINQLFQVQDSLQIQQPIQLVVADEEIKQFFLAPPTAVLRPTGKMALVVTLRDSPLHRLLLHAICQFHNMHSKSFYDGNQKTIKSTHITPYNNNNGQNCHVISLITFVLYHHRKNKDKDEVAVAGVITSQEQVGRMTSYLTLNDVDGEVEVE